MRHTLPEQLLWTLKLPWLQALLAWPICATILRRLVQLSFFQCSFDVFAFIADCLGPGMATEGMSESAVAVMRGTKLEQKARVSTASHHSSGTFGLLAHSSRHFADSNPEIYNNIRMKQKLTTHQLRMRQTSIYIAQKVFS